MSGLPSPGRDAPPAWHGLRRLFRIALDPRKLVLAGLGLLLFWCGEWIIAQLPFGNGNVPAAPWDHLGPLPQWGELLGGAAGWIALFDVAVSAARQILRPLQPLMEIVSLPFTEPRSWSQLAIAWTRFFWSLAVWSVFGGAIARLAAVEFARRERASLWSGLSFALVRSLSFFSAPLLPVAAIFLLWGLATAGGTLGLIPYAGEPLVALLWGIGFCLGLLIVLVAIATAAGWPLMVAEIAAENTDAFDGFSRSFCYLYGRPWLFVWCAALCLAAGSVLSLVVEQAAILVASATSRSIATAHNHQSPIATNAPPQTGEETAPGEAANLDARNRAEPTVTGGVSYRLADARGTAGGIVAFWHGTLFVLASAFSTSFFFSAGTVIYFVLRRADDGTHFDEVWIDEPADEEDLLPLSGIAATDQPVAERSHHPTVDQPEPDRP